MHLFGAGLAYFVLSRSNSPLRIGKSFAFERKNTHQLSSLEPIEEISTEVSGSKYEDLLEWLKSNGASVNDNLSLLPSSRGGGYGAFVMPMFRRTKFWLQYHDESA